METKNKDIYMVTPEQGRKDKEYFRNTPKRSYMVDGEKIWHSRSLGVVIHFTILTNNTLYILANKRGEMMENEPNKWSLPGGYLDWDESITDAVKRELWEENGLYLDELDMTYIYSNVESPHVVNSNPTNNEQNLTVDIFISAIPNDDIMYEYGYKYLPQLSSVQSEGEATCVDWLTMKDIENMHPTEWGFNHQEKALNYMKSLYFNGFVPINGL